MGSAVYEVTDLLRQDAAPGGDGRHGLVESSVEEPLDLLARFFGEVGAGDGVGGALVGRDGNDFSGQTDAGQGIFEEVDAGAQAGDVEGRERGSVDLVGG